jgi:hypothetical protein
MENTAMENGGSSPPKRGYCDPSKPAALMTG